VQGGADPAGSSCSARRSAPARDASDGSRERVKEAGLDKQLTIPDGAMIQPSASTL